MNQPDPNKLREANWRRPMTDAEEVELRAALAKNPDVLAEFEAEVALSRALSKLPDAPVPSNFTARVLQAVELEAKREARARRWLEWFGHGWLPRAAIASLLVCAGLLGYHRGNVSERKQLANQVAAVSAVVAETNPEDLDAIFLLNKPASADTDLLAALAQ